MFWTFVKVFGSLGVVFPWWTVLDLCAELKVFDCVMVVGCELRRILPSYVKVALWTSKVILCMVHSDERCMYHMIFHRLYYNSYSILNINYPHVTHIRLLWMFMAVPLCPRTTLNIQGSPWHGHPLALAPRSLNHVTMETCYHGDILESSRDVPEW